LTGQSSKRQVTIAAFRFRLARARLFRHNADMKLFRLAPTFLLASLCTLAFPRFGAAENAFLGNWALTLPGGQTGWLGVESSGDGIKAEMLWAAGSVFPLDSTRLEDRKLVLTRIHETDGKTPDGKPTKIKFTETITATLDGQTLKLTTVSTRADGKGENRAEFSGKRLPPMPPSPDLSKVKFGTPIELINGTNLDGWRLTDPNAANGWNAKAGILSNDQKQQEGKPHKNYGNLRTDAEFEDFSLHAETRLSKDGNSGIYLRGIYEVQVFDSFGKPLDSHNMGAIYSRITPAASVEKPAGEWQTLDITLVNRHASVVLNGTKIIDNQPVLGPTGGALWPEVDRPGPIYLQGDHTGIEYRNLVLRPALK
jgi:hypothetical protein